VYPDKTTSEYKPFLRMVGEKNKKTGGATFVGCSGSEKIGQGLDFREVKECWKLKAARRFKKQRRK